MRHRDEYPRDVERFSVDLADSLRYSSERDTEPHQEVLWARLLLEDRAAVRIDDGAREAAQLPAPLAFS